jgi:UDP-2,3-diacylglucosamine pyrophosphatase LpxH
MTKFYYCSDLHLEFGLPRLEDITGENIILAGDILTLVSLNPIMNDAGNRKKRDRFETFFRIIQENFKRVFYITGNHEFYNFDIASEQDYISKYLPDVIPLNNSSCEFDDGTVLMGGTLWTDMNKNNPMTHEQVGKGMNDFRLIYNTENDPFAIFTTQDAYWKHWKTMAFLSTELEKYRNRKVVVATHHAPSRLGVNPEHSGRGGGIDHGYYSDLDEFILNRPEIKYWIHGHTHIQAEYDIGSTKVVSNARGYEGYESSADKFTMNKWVEV